MTEFLGRAKLRSDDSDSDTGYRNGYGRARRLTLSSGDTAEAAARDPRYRGAVREPAAAAVRQRTRKV